MGKKKSRRRNKVPPATSRERYLEDMLAACQYVHIGEQLVRCTGECGGELCQNMTMWKTNSNLGYTADNTMLVCCFVAQQLSAGATVNGHHWDRTTGLTS